MRRSSDDHIVVLPPLNSRFHTLLGVSAFHNIVPSNCLKNQMRKIITNTFMTLDGVMQAPGGPDEDTDSGFEYGGWSVIRWDQLMNEAMIEAMKDPYDL
ncbi:hypothetical protein [Dyadobacter chenhuakuii]|uniref:Uncharacterized protein n=1 Tax=Dyadobacter chenhuakuii TaxID=2909339 RepID=A0A9X1QGE2_9BACT|nr:hypothetical protein [Dyadobacter chenhuakuii]MCF2501240.1 hypothetical protein [Dyadobacter chenhuakuii]